MDSLLIPLVDSTDIHSGWSVQIDQCSPGKYQYLLVEHLPLANRAYVGLTRLDYPEIYIALQFAIAHLKLLRRDRLEL